MRICTKCKKLKENKEFRFRRGGSKERVPKCRACYAEYAKELLKTGYWKSYYQKNRDKVKKAVTEAKQRVSFQVLEYLKVHPCVDCGDPDPLVLEFDHVRGKKKAAICTLQARCNSWPTLFSEIQKCDVRCASCHARKTAEQRQTFRWLVLTGKLKFESNALIAQG